ncbi:hypothetical protein PpBr36_02323 [Pyricularia pennisetigena]|uniref:hypothetical protein n=1 Tax=Pyricularia pennisetigena TaxID=1578925 RepID=UPI00115153E7|nr:hypothetical protein PpBr36_02323 [Pyricularia pennisetigena]TLS30420.1 hypothetical protein PpBr36_02323 [Pyricularia pennisetigena]
MRVQFFFPFFLIGAIATITPAGEEVSTNLHVRSDALSARSPANVKGVPQYGHLRGGHKNRKEGDDDDDDDHPGADDDWDTGYPRRRRPKTRRALANEHHLQPRSPANVKGVPQYGHLRGGHKNRKEGDDDDDDDHPGADDDWDTGYPRRRKSKTGRN